MIAAIGIVRHCIMSRIKDPFRNVEVRKKVFHPEISFQKSMRIMFGSRIQERKDRQVAFRISSNQHIQVIPMIKTVPGRIPSDITVRLGEVTFAFTVMDSFVCTATNAMFPFSGGSNKRGSVAGNRKRIFADESFFYRLIEEFLMINMKKGCIRLFINGKSCRFQLWQ